jgi:hypothetical protein
LYSSYLAAENGQNYFTIACHAYNAQPGTMNSFASILSIDTGEFFGINNLVPETITNNTRYDIDGGGVRLFSPSENLLDVHSAVSTVPSASFNLTFEPRGPTLYHGASGIHYWGNEITSQWAHPQMWTTGTITVNGTELAIVPERSLTWFDRQWGRGIAYRGWFWYNIFLSNGLTLAAWRTFPVDETPKISSFATVLFPDGHHEIHTLDPDVHESDPFVVSETNLTYYGSYRLSFPTLKLELEVKLPVKAGELTFQNQVTATFFEGFAEYTGTYKGKGIEGFGVAEQVYGA